ncbi:MAG: serine hydroxymethyltransferase, partial [Gammaproteobacteria bacterium]|nr:serine hydroxymethyltransferase [Gammaproteobacteria bacterium]
MDTRQRDADAGHFSLGIDQVDADLAAVFADENRRQQDQIELIASENLVSRAVL